MKHARAGFTLVELLVVVLIIGIMATVVTISVGGRALDDRLENEARRLHQILQLAAEESVVNGIDIGFRAARRGYGFAGMNTEGAWDVYAASGPLRERELPEPMHLELFVEGRPAKPPEEDGAPQVLLLSSGEMTPFVVEIRAPRHTVYYELSGDPLGRIELIRREEGVEL